MYQMMFSPFFLLPDVYGSYMKEGSRLAVLGTS